MFFLHLQDYSDWRRRWNNQLVLCCRVYSKFWVLRRPYEAKITAKDSCKQLINIHQRSILLCKRELWLRPLFPVVRRCIAGNFASRNPRYRRTPSCLRWCCRRGCSCRLDWRKCPVDFGWARQKCDPIKDDRVRWITIIYLLINLIIYSSTYIRKIEIR